jgi:hypothetical protein
MRTFGEVPVNGDGNVAFTSTYLGGPGFTGTIGATGIFSGSLTAPALIASRRDLTTDTDGVPVAGRTWTRFQQLALPAGGGPVFIASTFEAPLGPIRKGLWATDSTGATRQLLLTGTDLATSGIVKTVRGFGLLRATSPVFGATRSFNATGSIAALVTFTDSTQSLVRFDLP